MADLYGMGCYNCDADIEGTSNEDVEHNAIKANWHIGLMASGQAYYSCPDCANGLFNATPLVPVLSALGQPHPPQVRTPE